MIHHDSVLLGIQIGLGMGVLITLVVGAITRFIAIKYPDKRTYEKDN